MTTTRHRRRRTGRRKVEEKLARQHAHQRGTLEAARRAQEAWRRAPWPHPYYWI